MDTSGAAPGMHADFRYLELEFCAMGLRVLDHCKLDARAAGPVGPQNVCKVVLATSGV